MIKQIRLFWYKLSIKNKILFLFILVIFLYSAISFYNQKMTYLSLTDYQYSINKYYNINNLMISFSEHKKYLDNYIKEPDTNNFEMILHSKKNINSLLEIIDTETESKNTYLQMRAIFAAKDFYFTESDKAIEAVSLRLDNYYISYYKANMVHKYIEDYIQSLLKFTLEEGNLYYSQEMVARADRIKTITIIAIFTILIIGIIVSIIFAEYLTRPIRRLALASKKIADGDLDVPDLHPAHQDELGVLAHSFNKMKIEIQFMIQELTDKYDLQEKLNQEELKNIQMQKSLKEFEFEILQSQINPHFLFNTLNTIARTATFEKAKDTNKLIIALAKLLRYNIGNSHKISTLETELTITKEYLYIQQYRFGNRLKILVESNINGKSVFLPSFTIQPLVENSIIHGLEVNKKQGILRIKVFEHQGYVTIKIFDNGLGIPKEKVSKFIFYDEVEYKKTIDGIGLINIKKRLDNYFNNQVKFKIISKLDLGTLILLRFPLKEDPINVI